MRLPSRPQIESSSSEILIGFRWNHILLWTLFLCNCQGIYRETLWKFQLKFAAHKSFFCINTLCIIIILAQFRFCFYSVLVSSCSVFAQFQLSFICFISVSSQFHLSFISVSSQFHLSFNSVSSQFQLSFSSVSSQFHLSFSSVSA